MSELATVLLLLAGISATIFVYPYLLYPLVLMCLPKVATVRRAEAQRPPSATLLFCAYNEEEALPEKIANVRALVEALPELKVLAYSDGSSDRTETLLLEAQDVLTPVISKQRLGKVLGMHRLATRADTDVLICTDANVLTNAESVRALLRYFEDPKIGSVGAQLKYVANPDDGMTANERTGSLYWRLEEWIKSLESETGSMMGADGSLFACRRASYPLLPDNLVDDLGASINVLFEGKRCVSAPDVIAIERGVADGNEEFRRKRRIACGSYSTYRHFARELASMPLTDRFKFTSHKVLRWWGAFWLVSAWACAFGAALVTGLGGAYLTISIAAMAALAVGARFRVPLLGEVFELLRGVIATGLGVLEAINGRTYSIWKPASSR